MMRKTSIKIASILNLIFYLVFSVVSIYLTLYISQFTFEVKFLPEALNNFCEEYIYSIFLYVPLKILPPLFETHNVFLLVIFALTAVYFAYNFMCFTYSMKMISISSFNDYSFLDEKRRIVKYIFFYLVFVIFSALSFVVLMKDFGINYISTKVMLGLSVFEFLMILLILIGCIKMKRKYVNG